jgi:hypothetical protein
MELVTDVLKIQNLHKVTLYKTGNKNIAATQSVQFIFRRMITYEPLKLGT